MLWQRARTFQTTPIPARKIPQLNATQARVAGFDLDALQDAHVVLVGAGGIGSQVAPILVRKGIGRLTLADDDIVEIGNLTRQIFGRADIGRYKAIALARRLAGDGLFPTSITALPFRFGEALERGHTFSDATILVAGVDNNPARREVAAYGIEHNIPVIHAAVSRGGNESYVMIQQPRRACWGCAFPTYLNDASYPCQLPGIADILAVVAGTIVFAVDTLLADRPREWNVRETFLDGSLHDRVRVVERRADCALCGHQT